MSILSHLNRWFHQSREEPLTDNAHGLQLIVGLGNPGKNYTDTRHNAGERWVRTLAQEHAISLKSESRFQGEFGHGKIFDHDIRLLIPTTFMNLSGHSVSAVVRYFKISPTQVLVVHDEVAFPTGVTKLKVGGGLNGHRGLESIVQALSGNKDFLRLRIGVGHPGPSSSLSAYLTKQEMSRIERESSAASATIDDQTLQILLAGKVQRAMGLFHTSDT